MTPEAEVAMWQNAPLILAALGTIVAPIVTHLLASKARAKATTLVKAAAAETGAKLDHIAVQTNGQSSAQVARIEALENRIAALSRALGSSEHAGTTARAEGVAQEKQRQEETKP